MGSEASIGLACDGDLDDVVGLFHQQLTEHGVISRVSALRAAVAAVLRDNRLGFVLTARKGGFIVGAAYVSFVWSLEHAGRAAWLEEMYVIPECRNAGLGRALLIEAMARSMAEGCRSMDLEVDGTHSRAGNLYERHGFVRLGRTRWVNRFDRVGS